MEERYVGRSGLRVSPLGLGTLTWGRDTDEHEARDQLRAFVEAGGTLVDTADSYGGGAAEAVLGALLAEDVDRSEVVLCTKAGIGHGPDAGRRGRWGRADGSARSMLAALDRSLARLGTDHVDLWLAHSWDPWVPVEETLRALQAAESTGRARYVGVADHSGWQLATAAAASGARGLPLVAASVELSLLQRAAEREVVPAAAHHGLGLLAWAPLAHGVLTGKYRGGAPADSRATSAELAPWVRPYLGDEHRRVVHAVSTAAQGLGVAPLEVALAWVRDSPGVVSAVVGARTAGQLLGALEVEDLVLPPEIRAALDDVSRPSSA
ncbi:aldo/keto reductase [Quadrisphaera sp. DSM 44207]|uniref:aldo/keto reductase n=1 Tax=Quadrisphaera sp. DSM 44207 TaxID=1881057 RepID=UPI00088806DC|nr:aldo/keto reductase [Quadrisphaera sp. DSM 44207]SDQ41102.1 Predicted oxidoreductase [Quadrisphaera sp. DSM 44207]